MRQLNTPAETVEIFRSRLLSVCSQSLSTSGTILVVSYDRKAVNQTGSGHYAVVGGYHPKRDLLLILETAAFKYPPHWAPLTAIYNGMRSLDKATGHPRGYMLMTKASQDKTALPTIEHPQTSPAEKLDRLDSLAHVNQLLSRLTLFSIADASYQVSLLHSTSLSQLTPAEALSCKVPLISLVKL